MPPEGLVSSRDMVGIGLSSVTTRKVYQVTHLERSLCFSTACSLRNPQRALPTEAKVESGTSQCKSGTSVNLSNSGKRLARSRGPQPSTLNLEKGLASSSDILLLFFITLKPRVEWYTSLCAFTTSPPRNRWPGLASRPPWGGCSARPNYCTNALLLLL